MHAVIANTNFRSFPHANLQYSAIFCSSKDFELNVPFITSDCGSKGVNCEELHSKNLNGDIQIDDKSNMVVFLGSNKDHKNGIPKSQNTF